MLITLLHLLSGFPIVKLAVGCMGGRIDEWMGRQITTIRFISEISLQDVAANESHDTAFTNWRNRNAGSVI